MLGGIATPICAVAEESEAVEMRMVKDRMMVF